MIIYKDLISGDEFFSDAYPVETIAETGMAKVQAKSIAIKNSISDNLIGGNASAECENQDDVDDQAVYMLDVVYSFKLNETMPFNSKKEVTAMMKGPLKKIMEKIECPKAKAEFKEKAPKALKFLQNNYKDIQCYIGEKNELDESGYMFLLYEGETPYFYTFEHGVFKEKV